MDNLLLTNEKVWLMSVKSTVFAKKVFHIKLRIKLYTILKNGVEKWRKVGNIGVDGLWKSRRTKVCLQS